MAGLKQAKRVSWPTDGNLCKVRLFLSEDAPSQSVLGTQDQLQAKATWLLHAAGLSDSDDSLPPGFEAPQKYHHPKIEISQIPLIKWQCPPRLILNSEWLVVAGEESKEVAIENLRQSGVLEAIYPRPSSVPLNPFVTPDIQATHFDDSCTPSIPITAIEDEDGVEQLDTSSVPNNLPALLHNLQNNGTLQNSLADLRSTYEQLQSQSSAASSMPNLLRLEQPPSSSLTPTATAALLAEPDVFAAASAAFTAIMKSSEEGSLIDHELLINILSDPVMVKRLASEYGDSQPQQTPPPQSQPVVSAQAAYSRPPIQSVVNTQAAPSRATTLQPNVSKSPAIPSWSATPPVVTATVAGPSRALPSQMSAPQSSHVFQMPHRPPPPPPHILSTIAPVRAPPPVRDANYYKSLIQLHGGEKQEARENPVLFGSLGSGMDPVGANQRDHQMGKVSKPCAYFNTPRGCRHGSSCLFQHDASSSAPQRIEQHNGTTKRIKLEGGMFGRN
ncbi:uncharacterized protein A4U43_C05F6340 [Asparagus officinalis]|uniref:C3H1-type domain-containing protein n=1 Tax=Asparagus officinalis TaxID=4686 RepID=A0A5P1ETH0_ASPOF|nr:zinc finger CCCH domain-containing protein 30 [Asparagus officinalis]ONK68019.1 uncharacterized protein A4U43_C05F6340 [Asparagus officinalis]